MEDDDEFDFIFSPISADYESPCDGRRMENISSLYGFLELQRTCFDGEAQLAVDGECVEN